MLSDFIYDLSLSSLYLMLNCFYFKFSFGLMFGFFDIFVNFCEQYLKFLLTHHNLMCSRIIWFRV